MQNSHSGRVTSFSPATATSSLFPSLSLSAAAVWSCHGRLLGNQDWGKDFRFLPNDQSGRAEGGMDGAERRGEGRQPILCWTGDARQDECNKRWVSTAYQSFESSRLLIGSDQGADGIKTYVDRLMFYSSELAPNGALAHSL